MGFRISRASCAVAGFLLGVLPAMGQLEVGDNLSLHLNGNVGAGYSASYGNQIDSSHSLSGSGNATLSGDYYNPNFLSFNVNPYYGQSRANSTSQSIFDSTGVTASASIFSGSHFPGSISYAKSYNSEGNFGLPGVADYTTRGNSDTFGITWSELLPDKPSLSATFQKGSNEYSVFGTDQNGSSSFRALTLHSGYQVAGFGLGAFYQTGSSHSLIPQLQDTQSEPEQVNSDNSGYGFNVSHLLPLRGGFSASYTHSEFGTNLLGTSYNGSVDTIMTSASIQPTDRLRAGIGADYSDSLSGELYEQIVAAGAVAPVQNLNSASHGMDVIADVGYAVAKGLQAEASAERREQRFLGQTFAANSYGGSLTYTRGLLGGSLNAAMLVRDNRMDGSSQNNLGFSVTSSYTRRINDWVVNGAFNYSQNVQTLLITYMTSFYNYSGNVRRRFGKFNWSGGVGAGRTGLTGQSGATNRNESFTTSFGYSHYLSLTGSYSKGSGNGVETANGVIPNPVTVPIASSTILFSGDSYSVGLGTNPARKLTLSASFSRANSSTVFQSSPLNTSTNLFSGVFQYQFRKMYLNGGYSRIQQGFSTSASGPAIVSSYYFGISRWFDFF